MTPDEFLRAIQQAPPAPAYLFVGPEPYARSLCRRALTSKAVPVDRHDDSITRHDLDLAGLPEVMDDACSFSLFASERLIWVSGAEVALPKGRAATDDNVDGSAQMKAYLKNPVPGVVVVFDCCRYEFDGDDKAKIQRVQKLYSGMIQVEFQRYSPAAARKLAVELAKRNSLKIASAEIDLLVELLGADAARIASEIEKLSSYAGTDKAVSEDDILALSPSAKASTIFALVNAVGRNDRTAALESLDVLVREGEYLPLALSFLSSQFRFALVAKEAKMSNPGQIQAHFSKQGTPMWRSRAEQVAQTAAAFSTSKLRSGLRAIYGADKSLRDTRPDDRIVMERFVLELTER